jgi:sRNA-binding carbon storage regulator CsrA
MNLILGDAIMLVLSCQVGEEIHFSGDVTMTLLGSDAAGKARLGFTGPGKVLRDKLRKRIHEEGAKQARFAS